MMRSLYAGVAGLKTHQTKMDVIGNNIANVNTTSFKSQSITFSDLMYQTTQAASAATETKGGVNARQIGLGAKSGAINTAIESQGATQTTNNPFDIMITGKAFFVVNDGSQQLYTRDGSFYVDGAGNLAMQSNGYLVMGWTASEDAETGEITVNKNGGLSNLQIMSADNSTYSPASTTSALISGNIDDNDSNVVSDDGKTITLELYDNKGYLYTAKFNIKDTGDDNLFSVELTDIIDSNGVSFTTTQMEGISFGDQQYTKDAIDFNDGYYLGKVSTDSTTGVQVGTIYQQSGAVAFSDVTASGTSITTLSDITNFLEKVYPTASTKRYSNISSYEINSDTLDVTFTYTDYSSSITNSTYKSFVLDNTDAYFYDADTNFGYVSPSIDGGKLSSLSTEMLSNIFNLTTSTNSTVMGDTSNYNYEFDDDTLTLTVVANKVPDDTDEITSAKSLKTKYDNYFVDQDYDGDGTTYTISDFISSIDTDTYDKGAYYEYNDTLGVLEIYGGQSVTSDGSESVSITSTSSSNLYSALISKVSSSTDIDLADLADDSDAQAAFDAIKAYLVDAKSLDGTPITEATFTYDTSTKQFTISLYDSTHWASYSFGSSTSISGTSLSALYNYLATETFSVSYSELGSKARAELTNLITNEDATASTTTLSFSIKNLTGTTGITATADYTVTTVDASEKIAEFKKYSKEYTASDDYEYDIPTVVFRDASTKKTGYVLFDEEPENFTLDEIPDNVLSTIYGVTKDEIKVANMNTYDGFTDDFSDMADEEFNVTFISGGKITITHEQTDNVEMSEDYVCDVTDGVATYTTASDIIVFPTNTTDSTTFELEGYISDLLSTADSTTKGLLETVFGVTDTDARAYGSEGYYVIDEDNGLMLYTSKADLSRANKTIQLEFDPSTGKIVAANGNETDMIVNLTFDQSVEGLEAFGFMETTGVDRDGGTIEVDFSTVTNYNTNGSSTIKAVKGDKSSLNTGRAVGEMNGVTVSTDGSIYATYSNGQTKLLGQIASAEFANASGLSKEGDNLYASTLNSGEATIQDITTDGGYMNTGVLEMSNVDLSSEFTEMITTQRGFQANSRIITVSDTLLEELTNLKR